MTLRRGDDVRISFSTWGGGAFHDSPEQDVSVYVDDEDEFDEHRAGGREPFATVGARWPREFRAAS